MRWVTPEKLSHTLVPRKFVIANFFQVSPELLCTPYNALFVIAHEACHIADEGCLPAFQVHDDGDEEDLDEEEANEATALHMVAQLKRSNTSARQCRRSTRHKS